MERRAVLKAALGGLAAAGCSGEDRPSPARATRPAAGSPGATVTPSGWDALPKYLKGRLVRPDDDSYDEARRLYIPRYDGIRPQGIAYCASPADVSTCLAFAVRSKVPVAVRCGGHSYAGWSTGTGLVIDVSAMSAVTVDGGRATVGAGTRLIDLYDRLAREGVGVPAGSCPTVGVAGLTLGGGLGVTSRAYGLTCDVLESVEVVTADGRIRVCDARRDAELFWACRGGGGGNFGVAVSFTFRTHRVGDVTPFTLRWPWSRAAEAIRGWQRWAPSAPDSVWTSLQLNSRPSDGVPSVEVSGVALDDAGPHMDRLTAAAGVDPGTSSARARPYMDAMKFMAGCAGNTVEQCHGQGTLPGQRPGGAFPRTDYAGRSHVAYRPLPDAAIGALLRRFEQGNGVADRSVLMDAMGGAIGRVRPGDTAFPHRAALFCVQYLAPDAAWLDGTHQAMEPYLGGTAYVNYVDGSLKGWARAYYGANLERLAKAKAAYDPGRLFSFPQAV
ncbi:FAD-binding oxidoreductase [Actinomadura graeca]|uniref:FAD-binding oxidoreductase n=1 Tax=Actinomadura graeca TaxID=2750812 RepID=A0ABX8R0M7_9ACTN|nr:FAD-binding oxidoreductase [Actinomadura graeca]QXJ24636.1 FAD-binding oxidoreductase [Actinomadura graeca]